MFVLIKNIIILLFIDESMEKKSLERNDTDKKGVSESGPDPSAPITRKGVLTSFLTSKPMEIPEQDIVIQFSFISVIDLCYNCLYVLYFYNALFSFLIAREVQICL